MLKNDKTISYFFLDPYSRSIEKMSGAWMGTFLDKTDNPLLKINGETRLPITHMNCNLAPPVGGKPSLLTFGDV